MFPTSVLCANNITEFISSFEKCATVGNVCNSSFGHKISDLWKCLKSVDHASNQLQLIKHCALRLETSRISQDFFVTKKVLRKCSMMRGVRRIVPLRLGICDPPGVVLYCIN